MSETAVEKADKAMRGLLDAQGITIGARVDREQVEAAIRAKFERAEKADLFERALGIACRYLSAAGDYSGGGASWRGRVLAEAARQAKEGELPTQDWGLVQADGTRRGNANGTEEQGDEAP